jgi:hypothetical protein
LPMAIFSRISGSRSIRIVALQKQPPGDRRLVGATRKEGSITK